MRLPGLKSRRRLVQAAVLLLMVLAPWLHRWGVRVVSGNFFAAEVLGLPLGDPLAAVQIVFSSRSLPGSIALGAGLALVLALVLGPVFCSYACPFGLLSELGQALSRRWRAPAVQGPGGFPVKAALALTGLLLVGVFGLPPLLNLLSMPGWFLRLTQPLVAVAETCWPALVLPLVLVLEILLGRRLWCRRLCPQSVLLALARRANPAGLGLRFEAGRCSCRPGEARCRAACTLGLDPRRAARGSLHCNNCGDCVEACAGQGQALRLGLGRPRAGTLDKLAEIDID